MTFSERAKAQGIKLETNWWNGGTNKKGCWRKKVKGRQHYFFFADTKDGYQQSVLALAQLKAKLNNDRPHADIWQHHKTTFQAMKGYYDQFGVPMVERKIAKQAEAVVNWIDETLLLPELPEPITMAVHVARQPEIFKELNHQFPHIGTMAFTLSDKWQDRFDRQEDASTKQPQTIEHWLKAYISRIEKRGGKFITEDTAKDRNNKLQRYRDFANLGAHITTIDDDYLERHHEWLDEAKNKKNGGELAKDSKEGYWKAFLMFVRWSAGKSNCELTLPTNIESREWNFREPQGTGRIREQKKMWLWTPDDIKTALNLPEPYPCYVLLMLNCGFKHNDIASLQWSDLRLNEGRIVIQRKKLEQQYRSPVVSYLLWPKTIELIEQTKSDNANFVFRNRGGGSVEGSIKTWWGRNRDKHGLKGKRLDYLRKTGSTFIAKVERNLDEVYLGETISSVAKRHYSFNDGEVCKALDEGIQQLGAEFGFCEPPTKTIELTPELLRQLEAAGIEI